jgi:hypothetical protein
LGTLPLSLFQHFLIKFIPRHLPGLASLKATIGCALHDRDAKSLLPFWPVDIDTKFSRMPGLSHVVTQAQIPYALSYLTGERFPNMVTGESLFLDDNGADTLSGKVNGCRCSAGASPDNRYIRFDQDYSPLSALIAPLIEDQSSFY